MGISIEQRKLDRYLREVCFPIQDVDVIALMQFVRSKGIPYSTITKLSGIPESNLRHFANPGTGRAKVTGKTMMAGYRLVNVLLQMTRALQKNA